MEVYENGICCEPDNVDALTEAIEKMIIDDDYRESVRVNAIKRSSFYSIDNTIIRWEELLRKVLKKKNN